MIRLRHKDVGAGNLLLPRLHLLLLLQARQDYRDLQAARNQCLDVRVGSLYMTLDVFS
jgi:hypothetical protein